MALNLNFNKNSELELNCSQIQDNSNGSFKKFTNPQNSANLFLNGLGTVVLKNKIEFSSLEWNDLSSQRLSYQGVSLSGAQDVKKVTGEMAEWRTRVLSYTIEKKHRLFPDAKIIVFGGAAHLRDKCLHEQLTYQNLRFVEITPIREATSDSWEQLFKTNYDYYMRNCKTNDQK